MGAEQFGEGLKPLRGAMNDVFALSEVFEEAGWLTRTNNGCDKDHLRKDIINLHKQIKLKDCHEVTICFFFATHGLIYEKETFLVPANTDRYDYDGMINASDLTEWVEQCVKGFQQCPIRCLFIFDACREDTHRGSGDVTDAEISDYAYRGLTTKLKAVQGLNPMFWYSCSKDSGGMAQEVIAPEVGYRGLFSFKLEEVLREGFSGNLGGLTKEVYNRVYSASQMNQQPALVNTRGVNEFKFDFSVFSKGVDATPKVADHEHEQWSPEVERLFSKKEYDRAIEVLEAALKSASGNSEKHNLLIRKGQALKQKKSYNAALKCFEESLRYTDKEDFETLYHIGSTKRLCGQLKEAETILNGLKERDGHHPYVLFNLGRLAETYGNTQYAIEYFEAVLRNAPQFEFRRNIKRDLSRLRKMIRAEKKKQSAMQRAESRRKVQEALAVFRPAAIGEIVRPFIQRIPEAFFSILFITILGIGLIIGCIGLYKVYFADHSAKAKSNKLQETLFLTFAPEGGDPKAAKWETVNSRWVRNHYADGAITMSDAATGLMWVYDADENGKAFWNAANDRCETLHYAGYDDWFLPDKDQLSPLYRHKGLFKDVRDSIWDSFPGAPTYWTSTIKYDEYLREYDDNYKLMIRMGDHGNAYAGWFEGENHWIWPCRKQK